MEQNSLHSSLAHGMILIQRALTCNILIEFYDGTDQMCCAWWQLACVCAISIDPTPVSGPVVHDLHSPLAVSSRNAATDPELSGSPWHSARQRICDASSTEPWAEVQHGSIDSKYNNDIIRCHTMSYDVWISLPHLDLVGRVVIHFWGPRWTQEDCPKAESIGWIGSRIVATGQAFVRNTSKPTIVKLIRQAEITGRVDGDLWKIHLAHKLRHQM